jgi:hypothetical protein
MLKNAGVRLAFGAAEACAEPGREGVAGGRAKRIHPYRGGTVHAGPASTGTCAVHPSGRAYAPS